MRFRSTLIFLPAVFIAFASLPLQAQTLQWKMQYFYDDLASEFRIIDLGFVGAARAADVESRFREQSDGCLLQTAGGQTEPKRWG